MLAPNVKLAAVLRSLVTTAETLRAATHQLDPATGDVVVDLKSTEVYLKVLTQITATYKLDPNKLLFAGSSAPPGSVAGADSSSSGPGGGQGGGGRGGHPQ